MSGGEGVHRLAASPAPHTSTSLSSVQPPANTASRGKSPAAAALEQLIAPVQCRLQRPVPVTGVARAPRQQLLLAAEPVQHLGRGRGSSSARRRAPAPAAARRASADLADDRRGGVVECPPGDSSRREPGKQLNGGRRVQRGEHLFMLPLYAQHASARHQELNVRAHREQPGKNACRLDNLLEIVDEQQRAPRRSAWPPLVP